MLPQRRGSASRSSWQMDAAAASGQPRAQDAATHSNSSSSPSRPRWRRQVRREKRGDYAERCTGLAWALSFVSRRSLLFHHAVTFIFQVAAVCMVGLLGDAEGKAALGLSPPAVFGLVVIEVLQACTSLFFLLGVIVHIKDGEWRTLDLSTLWFVMTIVFAGLYTVTAISYDSYCGGTQPCSYPGEKIHGRRVRLPELTSNVSFGYPDVWLKDFMSNRTAPVLNADAGASAGAADGLSLTDLRPNRDKQMRLAGEPGIQGAFLLFVQFWYFSVQLQTQVGIGDVIPVCWLARTTALVQMLMGVLFSATLVSLTLDGFRQRRKKVKRAAHNNLMKRYTASYRRHISVGGIDEESSRGPGSVVTRFNEGILQEGEQDVATGRQRCGKGEGEGRQRRSTDVAPNASGADNFPNGSIEDIKDDDGAGLGQPSSPLRVEFMSSDLSSSDDEFAEENRAVIPVAGARLCSLAPSTTSESNNGPLRRSANDVMDLNSLFDGSDNRASFGQDERSKPSVGFGTKICGTRMTNAASVRSIRRFLRRWLLFVTLTGQGLHLLWLYIVDGSVFDKLKHGAVPDTLLAVASMCVQVVMVVILVVTALVYVRHSERITLNYLIQCFLSVCVHFCGIYVMIFLFQGHAAWPVVDFSEDHLDGDADGLAYADGFWETAMRFMYLSIVIMTTTGCNSLSPKSTIAM